MGRENYGRREGYPQLEIDKTALLSRIENGVLKYNTSPLFNVCVNSIIRGADKVEIILQLIDTIEEQTAQLIKFNDYSSVINQKK